ncbi:integral membrane protein [Apodospora peruviana]|uniref:Integral membrane protein n=1 Tax=Apodospora peruviana TaxID=516989 RepID=A0AAE0HTW7_9PEZI|nr:integral membrane protein [Apodospora peruviana]
MSAIGSLPHSLPPDEDRGPQLVAMFWTFSAISILLTALRFLARVKIRAAVGWDDWMMLVTVVLFTISTCFVTYMASIGGARHVYYLSREQTLLAVKYSWISQPWAILVFATGKSSVALLTLRLIDRISVWRRYVLYFVIVTIFIACSLVVIFTFVQCKPAYALWTPGTNATCWSSDVILRYNYFLSAWNITVDVTLAVLPATFIGRLKNLGRAKRIAICVLLSLGIIAAVFTSIKIPYLSELGEKSDFTWAAFPMQVWTAAEAFVIILCGNVPPLQVFWDRFVTRKLDASYVRRIQLNDGGGSRKRVGFGHHHDHKHHAGSGRDKLPPSSSSSDKSDTSSSATGRGGDRFDDHFWQTRITTADSSSSGGGVDNTDMDVEMMMAPSPTVPPRTARWI